MGYKKMTLDEIKRRTKYMNPNMHILNDELPKNIREKAMMCHCDDCGGIFNTSVSNIRLNYTNRIRTGRNPKWCPVCRGTICVQGVNDINTVRPDVIKYLVDKADALKYTAGSKAKVLTECPICKFQRPISIHQLCGYGYSCTNCPDSVSYPNKILHSLLDQLPVDEYIPEYFDDWTEGRKYDAWFKLNEKNYLLEFDGDQHYHNRKWGDDTDRQKIDELKNKLAKDNNYILIRIDCRKSDFEYIKNNIYSSKLAELFDLDKIDWRKCALDAEKNIVFEVAKYYNSHDNITAADVAEALNITHSSAINYLNKATSIGLCEFDKDKSRILACKKNSKNHKNKQEYWFDVYDQNGNLINTYATRNDCINDMNSKYKDLNLTYRQLYKALNSGIEHNGFKFIYRNGLFEHYKNNKLFFEICDYYKNNYNLSFKQIANNLNQKEDLVSIYIAAGVNSKYINDKNVLVAYNNRYQNQSYYIFLIKYGEKFVGPIYGSVQLEKKLRELYPDKAWDRTMVYKIIKDNNIKKEFIYNDVLIKVSYNHVN